ncbi:alpha/beta hydrolase [Amycolatopsis ruanii]|nr:alpha/beta hydrolase [Amycolatopsis ruanii]
MLAPAPQAVTTAESIPGLDAIRENTLIREVDGVKVTGEVIEPAGRGPHPVLLYLHGGGFSSGCSRDYRNVTLRFAQAGFLVAGVDYRLCPQYPFPAAFEDCTYAVHWVAQVASSYHADPRRLVIAGDSAGANLGAAVAAQLASARSDLRISAAAFAYGVFDLEYLIGSAADDRAATRLASYVDVTTERLRDPRVSPIRSAHVLPPTYLVVGSDDSVYRPQSELLAARLKDASIEHQFTVADGLSHAFLTTEACRSSVSAVVQEMTDFLADHV